MIGYNFIFWFAGKIKTVALTNFDTQRLQIILENGIPIISNQVIKCYTCGSILPYLYLILISGLNVVFLCVCYCYQVQHSLVDMRPQQRMAELCQLTGVKLITYVSLSLSGIHARTHNHAYKLLHIIFLAAMEQ